MFGASLVVLVDDLSLLLCLWLMFLLTFWFASDLQTRLGGLRRCLCHVQISLETD